MPASELRPLPRYRGRNDWDDEITGPSDLAAEIQNLDPYEGGQGKKRHGITKPSVDDTSLMTDAADGWGDVTVVLTGDEQVFAFQTGQVVTGSPTSLLVILGRTQLYNIISISGTSFSKQINWALTYDSAAASIQDMIAVCVNGKLIVAGNSTENRLGTIYSGLFTPLAGGTGGRIGIKAPGAATVADTGAGGYTATLRYYRIADTQRNGSGQTIRRSNLGASVSFTPSGAGTAARITLPAATNENETHREIYVSLDDASYYLLATVTAGTATYDDSTVTANYSAGPLAPREGANYPFPSCKYLVYAFNRLIALGRWESSAGDSILTRDGHLYFSPPRGGDPQQVEEICRDCVDEKGYMPLAENANGVDRGLSQQCNGNIYAFQDRGIYQISQTGNTTVPLRSIELTKDYGAVSHQSIVVGEDEIGRPCVYFLNPDDGLRRIGVNGIEWCGKDVSGFWSTVNLGATVRVAHALWVTSRKQLWIWLATNGGNRPNAMLMLDVTEQRRDEHGELRGGWHVWTGTIAGITQATAAMSACIYGADLGDPASSRVPYLMLISTLGRSSTRFMPPFLYAVPFTGAGLETTANSANFDAFLLTKGFAELGRDISVNGVSVLADALASGEIQVRSIGNAGLGSSVNKDGSASLTPDATETLIFKAAENAELGGVWTVQFKVGDVTANNQGQWQIRQIYVSVDQGARWISRG